ncbi:hypothetical protein SU48_04555 [Deinococcus puniceus]|uniref:Uncharacterized protein n=1 Tax=Deinococcus puniceus TaxID=1182568 RepID=A0A172T881_9DEIO|nr:hypothetical protein SU48_04555 [Deinococcus puniceus]
MADAFSGPLLCYRWPAAWVGCAARWLAPLSLCTAAHQFILDFLGALGRCCRRVAVALAPVGLAVRRCRHAA